MPREEVTKALLNSKYIKTTAIPLSTSSFPGIIKGNQGGSEDLPSVEHFRSPPCPLNGWIRT